MVGMRDVAKRAGVSVSSVSLVINGTGYVSRDMREKVEHLKKNPARRILRLRRVALATLWHSTPIFLASTGSPPRRLPPALLQTATGYFRFPLQT